MATGYEQDYYGWIQEQAALLRAGRLSEADIEHIAEELEDMGKSEARGLKSQLARLLKHLLKWVYQPELREQQKNSWRASIRNARRKVRECLEENPSLKPKLPEFFLKSYIDAIDEAVEETNLPESRFPSQCPWTLEQVMDEEFWPDA
jgi:predicted  nucleic acid-binding Zn-ribbon protein